jgi:hypothetical protein
LSHKQAELLVSGVCAEVIYSWAAGQSIPVLEIGQLDS